MAQVCRPLAVAQYASWDTMLEEAPWLSTCCTTVEQKILQKEQDWRQVFGSDLTSLQGLYGLKQVSRTTVQQAITVGVIKAVCQVSKDTKSVGNEKQPKKGPVYSVLAIQQVCQSLVGEVMLKGIAAAVDCPAAVAGGLPQPARGVARAVSQAVVQRAVAQGVQRVSTTQGAQGLPAKGADPAPDLASRVVDTAVTKGIRQALAKLGDRPPQPPAATGEAEAATPDVTGLRKLSQNLVDAALMQGIVQAARRTVRFADDPPAPVDSAGTTAREVSEGTAGVSGMRGIAQGIVSTVVTEGIQQAVPTALVRGDGSPGAAAAPLGLARGVVGGAVAEGITKAVVGQFQRPAPIGLPGPHTRTGFLDAAAVAAEAVAAALDASRPLEVNGWRNYAQGVVNAAVAEGVGRAAQRCRSRSPTPDDAPSGAAVDEAPAAVSLRSVAVGAVAAAVACGVARAAMQLDRPDLPGDRAPMGRAAPASVAPGVSGVAQSLVQRAIVGGLEKAKRTHAAGASSVSRGAIADLLGRCIDQGVLQAIPQLRAMDVPGPPAPALARPSELEGEESPSPEPSMVQPSALVAVVPQDPPLPVVSIADRAAKLGVVNLAPSSPTLPHHPGNWPQTPTQASSMADGPLSDVNSAIATAADPHRKLEDSGLSSIVLQTVINSPITAASESNGPCNLFQDAFTQYTNPKPERCKSAPPQLTYKDAQAALSAVLLQDAAAPASVAAEAAPPSPCDPAGPAPEPTVLREEPAVSTPDASEGAEAGLEDGAAAEAEAVEPPVAEATPPVEEDPASPAPAEEAAVPAEPPISEPDFALAVDSAPGEGAEAGLEDGTAAEAEAVELPVAEATPPVEEDPASPAPAEEAAVPAEPPTSEPDFALAVDSAPGEGAEAGLEDGTAAEAEAVELPVADATPPVEEAPPPATPSRAAPATALPSSVDVAIALVQTPEPTALPVEAAAVTPVAAPSAFSLALSPVSSPDGRVPLGVLHAQPWDRRLSGSLGPVVRAPHTASIGHGPQYSKRPSITGSQPPSAHRRESTVLSPNRRSVELEAAGARIATVMPDSSLYNLNGLHDILSDLLSTLTPEPTAAPPSPPEEPPPAASSPGSVVQYCRQMRKSSPSGKYTSVPLSLDTDMGSSLPFLRPKDFPVSCAGADSRATSPAARGFRTDRLPHLSPTASPLSPGGLPPASPSPLVDPDTTSPATRSSSSMFARHLYSLMSDEDGDRHSSSSSGDHADFSSHSNLIRARPRPEASLPPQGSLGEDWRAVILGVKPGRKPASTGALPLKSEGSLDVECFRDYNSLKAFVSQGKAPSLEQPLAERRANAANLSATTFTTLKKTLLLESAQEQSAALERELEGTAGRSVRDQWKTDWRRRGAPNGMVHFELAKAMSRQMMARQPNPAS